MAKYVLAPIQEKWVKELETHSEKHLPNALGLTFSDTSKNKYCCLGMAAEIVKNNVDKVKHLININIDGKLVCGNSKCNLGDTNIANALGVRDLSGVLNLKYLPEWLSICIPGSSLMSINDGFYYNFIKDRFINQNYDNFLMPYDKRFRKKYDKFIMELYKDIPLTKRTPWILIAYIMRKYPRAVFVKPTIK